MPHNGTNNLTATQAATELNILDSAGVGIRYEDGNGYGGNFYDIYHDGYFAGVKLEYFDRNAVAHNADGSWSATSFIGIPETSSGSGKRLECIGVQDFDHDGFVDFVFIDYRTNPIASLVVALNQGGGVFNTISIPFAQALANVDNYGHSPRLDRKSTRLNSSH